MRSGKLTRAVCEPISEVDIRVLAGGFVGVLLGDEDHRPTVARVAQHAYDAPHHYSLRPAVRSSSAADGWRGAVLLVTDVLAPRDGTALLVDFLHRDVGHESVRSGAVPVVLAGLEEHVVTRADHLDLPAAALAEARALGDVDGLAFGVDVPRCPRLG